jgi:hypothetical protein
MNPLLLCLSLLLASPLPWGAASANEAAPAASACPVAGDGLYPAPPAPAQDIAWNRWLLDCVPPLRHERGGRWPLVFWHGPQWEGVSDADLKAYAARGMVPTVRLVTGDIPRAQRLQRLGLPVIALEGKGRGWPYDQAGDAKLWALDLPPDAGIPDWWRREPDPLRLDLWARAADQLRGVLRAYQAAGVTLDAAWLDYEGHPSIQDYQALLAAPKARAKIPAGALATPQAFFAYRRQLWIQLMSAYVAGPIREFYPSASVTNWIHLLSSPEHPVLSWDNWNHPDLSATLFTATNPVAYGIDLAFQNTWPAGREPERASVDRTYMHILLREVSVDALNRALKAPYLHAVPWVARWVRDLDNRRTPVMSRAAYREALRHLWLRGTAAMQVFNPLRSSHPAEALAEVQDAVAVYDELLEWRDLLDHGEVMNYQVPGPDDQGLLWSGLRTADTALVRLYPLGQAAPKWLDLTIWPGQRVVLQVSAGGTSYRIERASAGAQPRVLRLPDPAAPAVQSR